MDACGLGTIYMLHCCHSNAVLHLFMLASCCWRLSATFRPTYASLALCTVTSLTINAQGKAVTPYAASHIKPDVFVGLCAYTVADAGSYRSRLAFGQVSALPSYTQQGPTRTNSSLSSSLIQAAMSDSEPEEGPEVRPLPLRPCMPQCLLLLPGSSCETSYSICRAHGIHRSATTASCTPGLTWQPGVLPAAMHAYGTSAAPCGIAALAYKGAALPASGTVEGHAQACGRLLWHNAG